MNPRTLGYYSGQLVEDPPQASPALWELASKFPSYNSSNPTPGDYSFQVHASVKCYNQLGDESTGEP
ncbi:MAG: hypothetical protein DRJ43_03220 [Thermoprotei archaeon]|nr:MAG: hypothetical protein DRJ43_03220 [Thermoprotei archaeon]